MITKIVPAMKSMEYVLIEYLRYSFLFRLPVIIIPIRKNTKYSKAALKSTTIERKTLTIRNIEPIILNSFSIS